jgi:deazaflavin-dependent oxidoreductase (nitroreductase family)
MAEVVEMSALGDFNRALIAEFRSNGGRTSGPFADAPLLLLTTTGARSGRPHTTPLVHGIDGDDLFVIASMGGAPSHPAWFHNLVAHPVVQVEVGPDTFAATAVVVEGDERDRLYVKQATERPAFAEYQQRTSRIIPVVRLLRQD